MSNTALLVMDFVNEIVHPDGKFKGKGYADFCIKHNTFSKVANAIAKARGDDWKIVFVKVGFKQDYSDQPKSSPLFGKANDFEALKLDTWATEFHEFLDVRETDKIIVKNRVSPFFNTDLDDYLKENGIDTLYLAGVSTELVVQSAARDAHDKDYKVVILSDCCAAGSDLGHNSSLEVLKSIAKVM